MSILAVENLSFRYSEQDRFLFEDLEFSLNNGDILAVHGASGSGKTTLLYILNGIIPRHIKGIISGKILLENCDHANASLPELSQKISMIMQNPAHQLFFPDVEQELAFAPENLCLSSDEIEKRVSEALKLLDIEELRYAETAKLSYGQQKLTALAAVYTLQPNILMLDEPANGLSQSRKENVINMINAYSEKGRILVLADHDPEILNLANKKVHLS